MEVNFHVKYERLIIYSIPKMDMNANFPLTLKWVISKVKVNKDDNE